MAITDAKKVDYLWKKLGYGATKTDTNANKKAPNEPNASNFIIKDSDTSPIINSEDDITIVIPNDIDLEWNPAIVTDPSAISISSNSSTNFWIYII